MKTRCSDSERDDKQLTKVRMTRLTEAFLCYVFRKLIPVEIVTIS